MARQRSNRRRSPSPGPSAGSDGLQDGNMADRYHDLAEEMNARGAMELAVPFYRQALALLLAERDQWRAAFPGQGPLQKALPADALDGLLEAAGVLGQAESPRLARQSTDGAGGQSLNLEALRAELAELAEDLGPANAEEVVAALGDIDASDLPDDLAAERLAVLAKAHLLAGEPEQARVSYEQAVALASNRLDLLINTAAVRLVVGANEAALDLLRQVAEVFPSDGRADLRTGLLRNLATAEDRVGDGAQARAARLELFVHDPEANAAEQWLRWALDWREQGALDDALQLLSGLRAAGFSGADLLQPLAEALEEQGQYREAALVYRDLLRPAAMAGGEG